MQQRFRHFALLGALVAPLALGAQDPTHGPGAHSGPGGPGGPGAARAIPNASVTHILNARRLLDLSPRQLAQLDSIERALFAERRATEQRMRALHDSVAGQARERMSHGERGVTDAQRDSIRTRMETLRPQLERLRGRDSTARAAAQRVLTDAQRQQVREIQAEERGRQRGMREARGGQMRGQTRGRMRGHMRGHMGGHMRGHMGGEMSGPRPAGTPNAPPHRPEDTPPRR